MSGSDLASKRIDLDSSEVFECVEEALAWLAVASCEHALRYRKEDFRRASLVMSMAGEAGYVDSRGLSGTTKTTGDVDARPLLRDVGQTLRYAECRQVDSGGEVLTYATNGVRGADLAADTVRESDLGDALNARVVNAAWKLSSVVSLSKRDSLVFTKRSRVAGLRVIRFQEVVVFKDGRASSGTRYAVLRPDGLLLDPSGLSLDFIATKKWGVDGDQRIADAVKAAWNQRVQNKSWAVEISLSRERTGVAIDACPCGARELIRALRKSASSTRGARRGALLHWVREHYRKCAGGDHEAIVRAHLRGRQEADAGPYWVRLYPSRSDAALAGPRFANSAGGAS